MCVINRKIVLDQQHKIPTTTHYSLKKIQHCRSSMASYILPSYTINLIDRRTFDWTAKNKTITAFIKQNQENMDFNKRSISLIGFDFDHRIIPMQYVITLKLQWNTIVNIEVWAKNTHHWLCNCDIKYAEQFIDYPHCYLIMNKGHC